MEQNSSGLPPSDGLDTSRLRDVQSWRRSRSDRMVAGVCGGIGRALNVDPVLIRVVMAVLVLTGPGVLFYLAAWLLMPDEGSDRSAAQGILGDRVRPDHPWLWPVVIGACVFIAIAMMSSFNFGRLVPGPLVVLGLIWLFAFHRKGRRWGRGPDGHRQHWPHATPPGPAGYTGPETQPPFAGAAPYVAGGAAPTGPYHVGGTGPSYQAGPVSTQRPQDRVDPVQPVWTEDDPLGLYVDDAPAPRPVADPPASPRGRRVKPFVILLTGLAIGIAALAGSSVPMMLAFGLATLGAGMLVGGFLGRTLALLPLGILLGIGLVATSVFHSVPRDFVDTQFTATPAVTINATNATYLFDAGSVQLDLTKAKFAPDAKVVVHGGMGEVVVKVPANADLTGTLKARAGEIQLNDQTRGGHQVELQVADLGADGKVSGKPITLDLELTLGSIRVERG